MDEETEFEIEEIVEKIEKAEKEICEALETLGEIVELGNDVGGRVKTCVAGQVEGYTIGNLTSFISEDDEYRGGNLESLKGKLIKFLNREEEC